MRHHRSLLAWVGLAAATVTVAALASKVFGSRKRSRVSGERPVLPPLSWEDELAPDSTVFEPAPASSRELSARPRDFGRRPSSAEDAESLGSDELGSAYLARATGHSAPEDAAEDDELAGFQILDGWR